MRLMVPVLSTQQVLAGAPAIFTPKVPVIPLHCSIHIKQPVATPLSAVGSICVTPYSTSVGSMFWNTMLFYFYLCFISI
ncbi:hypothetical protein XENTR_v10009933 [Xenopus tropicalis]|nr:hypothetical protein XENTR_v10009933 [Xenopus tropicalis]